MISKINHKHDSNHNSLFAILCPYFIEFHYDLVFPLSKYTLKLFFSLNIVKLIFVKIDLSGNSTPDLIFDLSHVALVESFQVFP